MAVTQTRKERCPKIMPRAGEQCAKTAGHKGGCLTEYAVDNNRRYPSSWRVPA